MKDFEMAYSRTKGFYKRELIDFSDDLKEDEVLIKPRRVGICGSDQFYMNKYEGNGLLLGHEWVGEVVKSKSSKFQKADIVTSCAVFGCGICEYCINNEENKCLDNKVLGSEEIGMLRSRIVLKAKHLVKVKKHTWNSAALLEVAAIGDAVIDNVQALTKSKDEILILGAGSVGIMAALRAEKENKEYILVEVEPTRVKIAKNLGLNVKTLGEVLLKKEKYKIVADCTGDSNEKVGGVKYYPVIIKPGAYILVVGHYERKWEIDSHLFGKFSPTIKWMKGMTKDFYFNSTKQWENSITEIENQMVAKVFSIERTNEAFEFARDRKNGIKTLISINE